MARPLVIAHRGASHDRPENTVEAFREAVAQGADAVELDVRRSHDGALVVHHDAHLPDGRLVGSCARVDLPSTVPTLAEALDVCTPLLVNVEIKNLPHEDDFDPDCAVVDAVVALLHERRAAGAGDRIIVSSFHLRTVDRVRALDPGAATALLTFVDPSPMDALAVCVERGHGAIHPHDATVDDALVAAARAAGVAVNVWTVDDPDRIRRLAGLGVAGIVTNRPGFAHGALG